MRTIQIFEAFDGTRFEERADCERHEAENIDLRLVGLTIEQVRAALDLTDAELAHAIEQIAAEIGQARREAKKLTAKRDEIAEHEAIADDPRVPPEDRGRHAFLACRGGVVPDDLRDTKEKSEAWLDGWDSESVKAHQANQSRAA